VPWRKGKQNDPGVWVMQGRRKMQNSGNEAKKYLKTKHITFLNAANYARFARNLAQTRA
jgi:hypothetical protein